MSMQQDPRMIEYQKMMSSVKKLGMIKECFYHDKGQCKGDIKQAHSLQRNGRLSIIEGEVNGNSSIYTFTSAVATEKTPMADLKPIGKKEASTFFGFCDEHDTKLFSPIENFDFDGSDKHCFLHSYRSYAHSYHRKHEEQKAYDNPETPLVKMMPEFIVQSMKRGIDLAIIDSIKRKAYLDDAIENNKYSSLEYLTFQKKGLYPFAVSSQMSPKVSYKNRDMNNHINPDIPFSQPIITFLPDNDETFVVLAAFPDDQNAIMLLDELSELPDLKLEKAITSLIIANCENTFFSPLFWNNLSYKEKQAFLDEFKINTFNTTYHNKFFHSKFNFFDSRFEANKLGIIK
jgi:hypothetical protein